MKKTLLNLALVATLASVSAQGVNATAAYDDFAKASQYSVISTEMLWDSLTHTGNAAKKAYKGIFWWTKRADGKGLDFTKTRAGDGKQSYVANQADGAYEPLGVGFGTYAKTATDSALFTLDLTANKTVSFTLTNNTSASLLFKVGLQDANDSLLNGYGVQYGTYNKTTDNGGKGDISLEANDGTGPMYLYELNIVVPKNSSENVSIDFSGAVSIFYKLNAVNECKDQAYYALTNKFDFSKVKAFTITPLAAEGVGDGSKGNCYRQPLLTAGAFDISNFKIGDVTPLVGVSDEIIANFKDEVVTVYNFSGAFVAQGNVADLNLASGLYIFKSASKAKKVYVK